MDAGKCFCHAPRIPFCFLSKKGLLRCLQAKWVCICYAPTFLARHLTRIIKRVCRANQPLLAFFAVFLDQRIQKRLDFMGKMYQLCTPRCTLGYYFHHRGGGCPREKRQTACTILGEKLCIKFLLLKRTILFLKGAP